MGMLPGIAKMKNQIATANLNENMLKHQVAIIDSMTPRERRNPDLLKASRKKRIAAGSGTKVEEINKLLKMHRTMADMMKAMGSGKRGPLAGLANMMGMGGGMPSPEEMAKLAEKMPGGMPPGLPGGSPGAPGLPPTMPGLPPKLPGALPGGLPGLGGKLPGGALPGLGGFPGLRQEEMSSADSSQSKRMFVRKGTTMSLKIRMARAGTKKRPFYHIVVADSRSPRDGRFIERLGLFQSAAAEGQQGAPQVRLREGEGWLAKGAQPSDRIMRFLDAEGIRKREPRNNPEKAIPRKERKARAEAPPRPAAPRRPRLRLLEARLRRQDRRAAWRARRGQAVAVHRRPAGNRAVRRAWQR